jgi:trimeric autotransporter adhesin
LLNYLPRPNLTGTGLNYRFLTTRGARGNAVGASYTHNFVPVTAAGEIVDGGPTQQVSLNFNYGDATSAIIALFPALSGKQRVNGYSLNVGYTFGRKNWLATLNFSSSRNDAKIRNLFTRRICHEKRMRNCSTGKGIFLQVRANFYTFRNCLSLMESTKPFYR